jgi:hypothetical protein
MLLGAWPIAMVPACMHVQFECPTLSALQHNSVPLVHSGVQLNAPAHFHCCRLGPPAGHQLVLFVDDLNLPERQQYGAQPPLEMLRLLLDRAGLYDRCVGC